VGARPVGLGPGVHALTGQDGSTLTVAVTEGGRFEVVFASVAVWPGLSGNVELRRACAGEAPLPPEEE
jgi:hypothetical protein